MGETGLRFAAVFNCKTNSTCMQGCSLIKPTLQLLPPGQYIIRFSYCFLALDLGFPPSGHTAADPAASCTWSAAIANLSIFLFLLSLSLSPAFIPLICHAMAWRSIACQHDAARWKEGRTRRTSFTIMVPILYFFSDALAGRRASRRDDRRLASYYMRKKTG